MMDETTESLEKELAHFTGTQYYYKYAMFGAMVTDGVQRLSAAAAWLVTDILSVCRHEKDVKLEDFVCVKVRVGDNQAVVTYTDGMEDTLYIQRYKWTDLEDMKLTLYFTNNILMLASEY